MALLCFYWFFFLGSIWNFVILHKKQATKYEKAVFDAVIYLISQDRDDDVAVELYFKVCEDLNSLLRHSFPFMLICLFSSHVTLYLMSNVSLFIIQYQLLDWKLTWIEWASSFWPLGLDFYSFFFHRITLFLVFRYILYFFFCF